MDIPETDHAHLKKLGIDYEVVEDAGMICVILHNFNLPPGLSSESVDILFRFPALYPEAAPDMWWVSPSLLTAGGQVIAATQQIENYLGRSWQRWSRHLEAGMWSPGIDGIAAWMSLLRRELKSAAGVAA
jgi:hypothetical protein